MDPSTHYKQVLNEPMPETQVSPLFTPSHRILIGVSSLEHHLSDFHLSPRKLFHNNNNGNKMDSSVIAFAKSQTLALAEARKLELNDPLVIEGAFPAIQRSESPLFSPQPFVAESTNDTFLEAESCPYDYNDFEDDDEFDMNMNMEQFNHDDQYTDRDSRNSGDSNVPVFTTERTESFSHLESDLSQLKTNLASRFCYYMTASSSQILVLFYQFIGLISDHVAVIVADLLTEYFDHLRNRFKKLLATKQLNVNEVEGRVGEE